MAPSRAFSPPLPPNATYNHPKLALNILPTAKVFVAGTKLTGSMEVSCSSDKIALGEMALEFLGVEELRSPEHTAQTTVYGPVHTVFQGPSRPPSNAVKADAPAIGGHYYPALKGRTRFPFAFALPADLPSSLMFASNARLAYSLRGTCQVASIQTGERSLVTKTITVKLVERFADWADTDKRWEETVEARGEAKGEHGGVYAEARLARSLWWPGETSPGQGKVAVEVMVRNHTKRDISGMRLVLARQLSVAPSLSNGAAPTKLVTENIGESTFRGADYLFPGSGGERTVVAKCPLDVCVPTEGEGARAKECFTARGVKLFSVECVVKVAIEMGALSPDLMITLPITIAQALSLPAAAHKAFSPRATTDPGTPQHIDLLPPPQSGLLGLGGSLAGRTSPSLGSRPPSPAFSQHAPFAVNGWNCPPSPMASPLPSPRFYPADHPASRGGSPAMPHRQPSPAPMSLGPAQHQQWPSQSPGPIPYHQLPPPASPAMDPRTRSHSMGAIYQREPYQPPTAQQPPHPQYRPHLQGYQLAHSHSNPHLYPATASPMMSPYGGGGMVESPQMAPAAPASPVPWSYAAAPSPVPTYHRASPVPPPRQHLPVQSPAPPPRAPSTDQRRVRHQSMPVPTPQLPVSSLGVSTLQNRDWNSMPERPRSARGLPEPEASVSTIPRTLPLPAAEENRPVSRNSERSTKDPRGPPPAPSSRYSSSPKSGSPVEDSAEEAIRAAFAAAGIGVPSAAALETIGEKGESRAGTMKTVDDQVRLALKPAPASSASASGGGRADGVKIRSVKGVKPRLSEESVEALEDIAAKMLPGDAVKKVAPRPQPAPVKPVPEPTREEPKPARSAIPAQCLPPNRMLRSQSAGLAGLASMLSRSTSVMPTSEPSNDRSAPLSMPTPKSPVARIGTPTGSTSALRAKSTSISLAASFVDATPDPSVKRERPTSLAASPKTIATTWVPPMTRSRTVDVLPLEEEVKPKPEQVRRQIVSVAPEALLPASPARSLPRPSSVGMGVGTAMTTGTGTQMEEMSKASRRVAEWLKTSDSLEAKLPQSTARHPASIAADTPPSPRQLPKPPTVVDKPTPRSRLAPTESPLASSPTQLTRRSCIRRQGSSPNLATSATFGSSDGGPNDGESSRIEDELRLALEETNLAMEKATSRRLSTPLMRPPSRLPSPVAERTPAPPRKLDESVYKSARGGKGGQVTAVAAQWAQCAGGEDPPLSEVPRLLNGLSTDRNKPASIWDLSAALGQSSSTATTTGSATGRTSSEENRRPQMGSATGRGGGLQDLIRRWDSQRDLAAF